MHFLLKLLSDEGVDLAYLKAILSSEYENDSKEFDILFKVRRELAVKGFKVKEIEEFVNKIPKNYQDRTRFGTAIHSAEYKSIKKRTFFGGE